jgi:histidine ammonia-lyase
MSFLRAERMLNLHTRGSKIKNNENYDYLTIVNKKVSYLLNENKLLASPTNTDTILMDNFRHDIFTFDGLLFRKASKMIENVKSILQMEVQTSLEVLGTMYAD